MNLKHLDFRLCSPHRLSRHRPLLIHHHPHHRLRSSRLWFRLIRLRLFRRIQEHLRHRLPHRLMRLRYFHRLPLLVLKRYLFLMRLRFPL
jgi:hypothetical protein